MLSPNAISRSLRRWLTHEWEQALCLGMAVAVLAAAAAIAWYFANWQERSAPPPAGRSAPPLFDDLAFAFVDSAFEPAVPEAHAFVVKPPPGYAAPSPPRPKPVPQKPDVAMADLLRQIRRSLARSTRTARVLRPPPTPRPQPDPDTDPRPQPDPDPQPQPIRPPQPVVRRYLRYNGSMRRPGASPAALIVTEIDDPAGSPARTPRYVPAGQPVGYRDYRVVSFDDQTLVLRAPSGRQLRIRRGEPFPLR